MAQWIHLRFFELLCVPFFEIVESNANWRDGLSRHDHSWALEQGFLIRQVPCFVLSWKTDIASVEDSFQAWRSKGHTWS